MADDKSSQKNEMSMGGGCIRQLMVWAYRYMMFCGGNCGFGMRAYPFTYNNDSLHK